MLESQKQNRQRGKNFTQTEEFILVDLVEARKDILENKRSDAVTWKQKEECWQKLALEFVSQTGCARSARTLKDKYENLKRKSKIEIAAEKRETYRTGGGPQKLNSVSDVSEKIASLIGESATGLCNLNDSDFSSNNACNSTFVALETSTAADSVALNINNGDENINELPHGVAEIEISETGDDLNPAQLKEKKSQKLTFEKKCSQKRSLEEEKVLLTKLQQEFYRDENIRASEKHTEEIKGLRLKNRLLEIEIENQEQKKLKLD